MFLVREVQLRLEEECRVQIDEEHHTSQRSERFQPTSKLHHLAETLHVDVVLSFLSRVRFVCRHLRHRRNHLVADCKIRVPQSSVDRRECVLFTLAEDFGAALSLVIGYIVSCCTEIGDTEGCFWYIPLASKLTAVSLSPQDNLALGRRRQVWRFLPG